MSNARWLLRCLWSEKGWIGLASLLSVLDMAALLGMTAIQKWLIDDVILQGQEGALMKLLLLFGVLILGYNAVYLCFYLTSQSNEFRFGKRLAAEMMGNVHRMTVKNYQSRRVADIAGRVIDDIGEVRRTLAHHIPGGFTNVVRTFALSIAIGFASPVILAAILGLSALYIALGKYFAPRLKRVSREMHDARADVMVRIEEGISATREVLAYNRTDWELERYDRGFGTFMTKVIAEGRMVNKQLFWTETLRWAMSLAVLGYGGYLAASGSMSVGTLVIVFQFTAMLTESAQGGYAFFMRFAGDMAHIDRIREYDDGKESGGDREWKESSGPIRMDRVRFRYADNLAPVLDDLSLELPAGGKIAVVGASGGGKSTLAQLLLRFYDPERGAIVTGDIPIAEYRLEMWRQLFGIVFQEPFLFPDTIRNNLLMGRGDAAEKRMRDACRAAEIHEFIESLPEGYDTMLGERGINLSGGQRQRLALARTLMGDPEVLILDEATSALDMETERKVQRNLDEWRQGKTTIVIAHRLTTIRNAELILVLDKGRIAERGTHDELIRKGGVYANLVLSQMSEAVVP